jgi:hypothetical protein
MEPIGRVEVDRKKQRTLSELLDGFEELARRFAQCQSSLVSGQPLEGLRREVDSVLSIQAGVFVLIALDQGYLKCSNSSAWNPWALYKADIRELSQFRRDYTERDMQGSGLPQCLPEQNDNVASYYSSDDFLVLENAEPIPPSQRLNVLDKLLQQLEEFLDPFSEAGQWAVLTAWSAFLGLEIIPQYEMDFRSDWRNQLPIFFDRSMLDSRTNARHNKTWKAPGKTQDEQFRYCIQARADIYATSCRVIAKLLRAEIERRLSEMGGKAGGETNTQESPNAEFIIWDKGENYEFHAFGEVCSLKKSVGVERLLKVVKSPDRKVAIIELYQIGAQVRSSSRLCSDVGDRIDRDAQGVSERKFPDASGDSRFDKQTSDEAWEKYRDLISERDLARSTGDTEEAERLTKIIDTLLETESKFAKKLRDAVKNTIGPTIERFKKAGRQNLHEHFFSSVQLSKDKKEYIFVPAGLPIVWQIFER